MTRQQGIELMVRQRQQVSRPVGIDAVQGRVWIVLANGRAYGVPVALYRWLQLPTDQRGDVAFLSDRVVWIGTGDSIRIEEVLTAPTTREADNRRVTVWKRRIIILLEALESGLLRHRFYQICRVLSFSSWWGNNWPQE